MTLTSGMGFIVIIGALMSRHVGLQPEVRKTFVYLIVNVAMPCIILNSIFQQSLNSRLLGEMGITFALSIAGNAIGMLLGWLACIRLRVSSKEKRELAVLAGLGNTASMGLPLCSVLFGPQGTLLGAVFDSGVDFMIWTVVVFLLQDRPRVSLKSLKQLINVPILTIFAGLIMALFDWKPPVAVKELTLTLSNLTLPLTMLYIGMLLSVVWKESNIGQYIRRLWLPFLVKLIVFPLIAFILLHIAAIPRSIGGVVLVQASMPTLAMASIVFSYCKADEHIAAIATVSSTLLSFVTVPLIMALGNL